MLSDAIIMSIIVSSGGILALLFKLCYSSKCTTVKMCCLTISRDTQNEVNLTNIGNQTPNNI